MLLDVGFHRARHEVADAAALGNTAAQVAAGDFEQRTVDAAPAELLGRLGYLRAGPGDDEEFRKLGDAGRLAPTWQIGQAIRAQDQQEFVAWLVGPKLAQRIHGETGARAVLFDQ